MSLSYVLITPAYNEERSLRRCITSVAAQTLLPMRWVIVSDGSTDRTDEIARAAASRHRFIDMLRLERPEGGRTSIDRVSHAVAAAMKAGVESVASLDYRYLGRLDADVTMEPGYFEKVIGRMEANHALGLAAGGIYNVGAPGGFLNPEFAGGPARVFRKECWDAIGGLLPFGHEDVTSVFSARMKGWTVRSFPEIRAYQHEVPRNTVRDKVPVCFHLGEMDYIMGTLLSFELARSGSSMLKHPVFLAGGAWLCGYVWAWLRRMPIELPEDLVEFMRAHERRKLRERLRGGLIR